MGWGVGRWVAWLFVLESSCVITSSNSRVVGSRSSNAGAASFS